MGTLKSKYPPLFIVDLLCYITIYIELSMKAKGLLILKEAGINPFEVSELQSKLTEIKFLEKNIGYTGKLAIQPIIYNEKVIPWIEEVLNDPKS